MGAGNSNVAKVSSSGRLSVDAGLPTTSAGQVQVAGADPGSLVAKFAYATCSPGGFYKIPSGKALIITSVSLLDGGSAGTEPDLALTAGPSATPCTKVLAAYTTADLAATQNQVFPTGIPVPAGDVLGLYTSNGLGSVVIYGYLVPASSVPQNVLSAIPAAGSSHLSLVRP